MEPHVKALATWVPQQGEAMATTQSTSKKRSKSPAKKTAKKAGGAKKATKKAAAKKTAKKAAAKKTPAKKTAKKAAAKKTAKKASAKKTTAKAATKKVAKRIASAAKKVVGRVAKRIAVAAENVVSRMSEEAPAAAPEAAAAPAQDTVSAADDGSGEGASDEEDEPAGATDDPTEEEVLRLAAEAAEAERLRQELEVSRRLSADLDDIEDDLGLPPEPDDMDAGGAPASADIDDDLGLKSAWSARFEVCRPGGGGPRIVFADCAGCVTSSSYCCNTGELSHDVRGICPVDRPDAGPAVHAQEPRPRAHDGRRERLCADSRGVDAGVGR
jgi:hypothetical protein